MRVSQYVALAGLLIAAGCARDGGAGTDPSNPAVVPFTTLVATVEAARYADYAGRPGVVVRDEEAFEEMRRYLVQRYQAAEVTRSVVSDGAVFDCYRSTAATPPAEGSSGAGLCPDGSIPVRRVTLDDLVRFPSLAAFLGKGPGPEVLPP